MSKPLFAVVAFLLLGGAQCADDNSGPTTYGPFHVKSVSNVAVGTVDCSLGPHRFDEAVVTMDVTGAHVCVNEGSCGSDYLNLFEFELEVPHVFSESDDPARPEFYSCGNGINGLVVGTNGAGAEIEVGLLGVPEGQDSGCVARVDVGKMVTVSDVHLRITVDNQGVLLGHEDYAPPQVFAEHLVACE